MYRPCGYRRRIWGSAQKPEAVEEVNQEQKKVLFQKICDRYGTDLSGKVVGVWGLAFKPNTDDMREAPSLTLIEELLKAGATVRAFDPVARETAREMLGDSITYTKSAYEVVEDADALAIVTEWNEFRMPDFMRIKDLMYSPAIFDVECLTRVECTRWVSTTNVSDARQGVTGSQPRGPVWLTDRSKPTTGTGEIFCGA